jgi:HEAT repeat protein
MIRKLFVMLCLSALLSSATVYAAGVVPAPQKAPPEEKAPATPSELHAEDAKKSTSAGEKTVTSDKALLPQSPQSNKAPLNTRVKQIIEQEEVLWPSEGPGLKAKPSGAATADAVLHKMGESEDPELRRRAVEGLRMLKTGTAGPDLLAALQDDSPAVREAAASSLVNAPPEVAFAAVMKVLTEGTGDEIRSVEKVLPRLRDSLKDAMLGTLMSPEENVKRQTAAAFSLGRMRSVEAQKVLIDLAWSGEPLLAEYSADALAYMGNPATIFDLIDLLKHSDPNVRCAIVDGLGRIGGPDAVNALSELATSQNEDRSRVRQRAVLMLARAGGIDAIPTIIQAMTPPDMAVREVAGEELRRMTGADLRDDPLLWSQWYVEQMAALQQAQATPPLVPSQTPTDQQQQAIRQQSGMTAPIVPNLPPELPKDLKPWYNDDDAPEAGEK